MMKRRTTSAAWAIGALLAAVPLSSAAATEHPATMIDNRFLPREITIAVGDTIIWSNQGDNTHTATSDAGVPSDLAFDTGDVDPGAKSKAITFQKEGEIPYHCEHHNNMKGKIIVKTRIAEEKPRKVTMIDNRFVPKEITIQVGESIIWSNEGDNTHTATSDARAGFTFNTKDVDPGQTSKPVKFQKKGDVPYHCGFHGNMKGKVIVKAAETK
jgi:plastocyanin